MFIYPNSLIKSDALVLLERMDDQSVDLVYLDPPWHTAWDGSSASKEQYQNFIYKVLQQVQRVLKSTGSLFMYSRPDLNLDFGRLLAEVFGVENFVAEYIVPVKRHSNRGTENIHETLLLYRISKEQMINKIYRNSEEDILKLFPKHDSNGYYTYFSLFGRPLGPSYKFEWGGINPPDGYSWRFSKERLDSMLVEGLIVKREDKFYQKKYYTSEEQLFPISTIWDDIPYQPQDKKILGSQNVKFLERIIRMGTNERQLVLDPFCGSGSSMEACLSLKREFIACDNSGEAIEYCKQRLESKYPGNNYMPIEEDELLKAPIVWDNYEYARLEDEITDIISKGEGAFVEFKRALCWNHYHSKKDLSMVENVLETISAFLNTSGGILLVGVDNNGSLIDLQPDYEAADPQKANRDGYELFLNNKIREWLGVSASQKYKISFYKIKGCELCRIDVEKSDDPIFLKDDFYMRVNNQSVKLKIREFYTLIMSRAKNE